MKIFNYFDFLLEDNSIDLPIVFGSRFLQKISGIDSPISDELRKLHRNAKGKYTLVDVGSGIEMVSFVFSNKLNKYLQSRFSDETKDIDFLVKDYIYPPDDEVWRFNRTEIRVGKFVKKIFKDKFKDSEVEVFVNKWKSKGDDSNFKLVTGYEIVECYKSTNYHYSENEYTHNTNPLMNSCMNDELQLVDFYKYCKGLSMLVLFDDSEHILGRALVWEDYKGRKIMDRIYYVYDKDLYKFTDYAIKEGWYYKTRNVSGGSSFTKDGKQHHLHTRVSVPDVFEWREDGYGFPYMDTFQYVQGEWAMNYLPEDGERYFVLNQIEGDYEEYSNQVDIYGSPIIDLDDYVYSDEQEGYISKSDAVLIDYSGGQGYTGYSLEDYVDKDYLEDPTNGFVKAIDGEWYKQKHCVWSDRENAWIFRPDAIYDKTDWVWWDNFHPGGK